MSDAELRSVRAMAVAKCTDGIGHVFAELADGLSRQPACGEDVSMVSEPLEQDGDVCALCADISIRWASEGEHKLSDYVEVASG